MTAATCHVSQLRQRAREVVLHNRMEQRMLGSSELVKVELSSTEVNNPMQHLTCRYPNNPWSYQACNNQWGK